MVINQDKCIGCGICTVYCPNNAIVMTEDRTGKGKPQLSRRPVWSVATVFVPE